mgnify:CR=1 FL=1
MASSPPKLIFTNAIINNEKKLIKKLSNNFVQSLSHFFVVRPDTKNLKIKKSHPNTESLNNLLTLKLSEVRKSFIVLQANNKDATARQIKKEIYKPTSKLTFFDFTDKYLEAENKINRHYTDPDWLSYIEKYFKARHLTFHIAQHTFATTISLSNGIPTETVSKLLGHTKIVATQIYTKVTERKVSSDIQNLKTLYSA